MAELSPAEIHAQVDELFRAQSGRILATLIRLLGNFELAEDALHDAFNAALQRIRPAADLSEMMRQSEARRAAKL